MNLYYIPKLKEGFEIWLNNDLYYEPVRVDIREIIFTTEFMDTLKDYCEEQDIDFKDLWRYLLDNLSHPVDYIFHLLNL